MSATEFSVEGQQLSNRRSAGRWIRWHLTRYKLLLFAAVGGMITQNILGSVLPILVGAAFTAVLETPPDGGRLTTIAIVVLVTIVVRGLLDLGASLANETIAQRFSRDARDEIYVSLLGKSQTYHNRQQVGDLMARTANDVRQLGMMVNPGTALIIDSFTALVVPIVTIALLDPKLLPPPLIFTALFFLSLRHYMKRLTPASTAMRTSFGMLNSGLAEAVTGVEVVKSMAQEEQEDAKFDTHATAYRDAFVEQGMVQARYLPPLLLAATIASSLLLGIYFHSRDQLTIGELITYIGLVSLLRFPTFISIFTFSLVQIGLVSARRILDILNDESDLDSNAAGHVGKIAGDIRFENVTFSYGGEPVLKNVSFHAAPGETVAIVGETGSGKSTLTKLINRIYDVDSGHVLVDGIDVRAWKLDSLRSQISTIEQDIVLFSRPVVENIGFSLGQDVELATIEAAARDAQADAFIRDLPHGYETVIGERGVTLSGGQRQRIAIARALITDPAILIIDDSTSAIDSQTEDEIQRAIRRVLEGRTTILITHRLSQIRWADKVVVLRKGEVVDVGSHDELLDRCALYRRIFARYDSDTQTELESFSVATPS
ncbi:MAG: ABC transporter ATP-binding protein/permease [Thermomicrobiales bacterium]|nr:ABC transporter ATP-binding protein/permease [Thermomicrobiales bacterium]